MFEGNPIQMNASLTKLRNLPPDTRVFCGHEYTAANLRFALTVDPGERSRARVPRQGQSPARGGQPDAALDDGLGDPGQSVFALR